jgi:hypothetical protein
MEDPQTALINLIEERKLWEALTSSPAWSKLVSVLQDQADGLQRAIIYTPLQSADEVFAQEFRKGQLEGRLSVSVTAEAVMSELDADIQRLKEQTNASSTIDSTSGRARHLAP